ncbi:ribonucleotide reductase stimulatory protein [Alkalibacterium putridalgicola]|uniref:Protein involved in ribonucleotide reduction n=1 Tax=Alkalibacterium putridalgicola TaxID=426703 RepID=A0A1H7R2X3_9LACT|nr:class Ib ribonucleoside-diphosphate reductase assembly flavoprotein NrdI [Alkalibacterium putridalgicola]GEK89045.1 ribonucleotide reductase assembly protein NrdI [Alkalibacterium putridalgicola]SEL54576.1 protein involved in ribonucleotide reduction [Alkalibacterium putridalgicola]
MKVVFFTLTGQTRKFVEKLRMDVLELNPADPFVKMNEPFIIVTPTYDKEVTEIWDDFLETGENSQWLKGVAGGGNINFGQLYVFTAKDIAQDYNVPLLHRFEFQGNDEDVLKLKKVVNDLGIDQHTK